jgi:tRNA-specific 2-thiouridylase
MRLEKITVLTETLNKIRVVCAMSGGVDSSVAAALLVRLGYDVIGVTLQVWPTPDERDRACCSLSAVEDARRVAAKLEIPHYVLNVQDEFRKKVIDPFINSYRDGETPNPCIECNRWIKFGLLLDYARELVAEYIATGHYAHIVHDDESGRFFLRRGTDVNKDQTYVLYGMTQDQLAHTLFPLSGYNKPETRELAAELGMRVAGKPDSQEICFVPDDDYRAFLMEYAPDVFHPGIMVDTTGMTLGQHRGTADYTIGQRRGLGIESNEPRYVVGINAQNNQVVIGGNEDLMQKIVLANDVVYGKYDAPYWKTPREVTAKVRSNMRVQPAMAQVVDGSLRVIFNQPQRAITPGQAVVCYDGDDVAMGGTIIQQGEIG